MSTTPNRQRRGVPRWVWVLAGLVVAIALVVGVSMVFAKNRATTATPDPTPAPSAVASGAYGCIAGRDNDSKSLIAGAKKQPQTEAGAAATAAGLMRFMMRYPWPSERELTSAFSSLSMVENTQEAATVAKQFRENAGPKTARTAGSSFADARYLVEPASSPEKVQLSIAAQAVTDGTLNGNTTTMTFSMAWSDGRWKLSDFGGDASEEEVIANGSSFVGGC